MSGYIGNGAYCYANSTSMLLESFGESIPPSRVEVLTGVGIGSHWDESEGVAWFNNYVMPDDGITHALRLLGFEVIERGASSYADLPQEALRKELGKGPVVVGALDMGHLTYNPNYRTLHGFDHYVLAYKMNEQFIHLHDPAGFPYVRLALDDFMKAWQAEQVRFKTDAFRMWCQPRRIEAPSEQQLTERTLHFYRTLYGTYNEWAKKNEQIINSHAIRLFAQRIMEKELPPGAIGHMKYFLFQLGARRANDASWFFLQYAPSLSAVKARQAVLFGLCHTLSVQEDWPGLAASLNELAAEEEHFIQELFSMEH